MGYAGFSRKNFSLPFPLATRRREGESAAEAMGKGGLFMGQA